jgi:hypothetical protein
MVRTEGNPFFLEESIRTLADELSMRPLIAHCHLGLGTPSRKIGRLEEAGTELPTAIDLFRAMEMIFWLLQAEAALARAKARYARRPIPRRLARS